MFPRDELGRITPAAHSNGRRVVTDDQMSLLAAVFDVPLIGETHQPR
ncbi:hypothetical protein ACWGI8_00290 [Streptomyces sp. NPDC054841]